MSGVVFGETIRCPYCRGRGSKSKGSTCSACGGSGIATSTHMQCMCRCGCPYPTRYMVCVVCVSRAKRYKVCQAQMIDVSSLPTQREWEREIERWLASIAAPISQEIYDEDYAT